MKPRSLMTAYAEGSIVSRELREMLNNSAAEDRFERELRACEAQAGEDYGGHPITGETYSGWLADDIEQQA